MFPPTRGRWGTGSDRTHEKMRECCEFGYKKSFTALPNGAALKVRATPLGFSFSGESVSQGCASFAALTSLHPGLI